MIARRAGTVVLMGLVAMLSSSTVAHAAYPGTNGKIAFARDLQIWTVNADGTGELQLTNDSAPSYDPEWSPNGTRILYTRGNYGEKQVRVMNADGSGDTQVTPEPGYERFSATWSPDGNRIAVVRRHEDWQSCDGCLVDQIRMSDPDGSRRQPHDSEIGFPVHGLEWSPQGDEFVYESGPTEQMTIEIDGVTGGPAETFAGGTCCHDVFGAAWSPDGLKVAFLRQDYITYETSELYVGNRDGSGLAQLPVTQPLDVEWSPDGTKLVVMRDADLFIVDADGTNEVPLVVSSTFEGQPDWQPLPGSPYPGYARPKGATPFYTPLVPAYRPCAAPNRTHGPPLAFASCAPPTPSSAHLTVGTPDANGAAANSAGHVLLDVAVGSPSTLPIEGDVFIGVSITDVRCTPAFQAPGCSPANSQGGPDFTGLLGGQLVLRSTDRYNLPSRAGREPATLVDTPVTFRPECFRTTDTARGGRCSLGTTANALLPGLVAEGRRANWEIAAVRVHERTFDMSDSTVFLTQGVFVP